MAKPVAKSGLASSSDSNQSNNSNSSRFFSTSASSSAQKQLSLQEKIEQHRKNRKDPIFFCAGKFELNFETDPDSGETKVVLEHKINGEFISQIDEQGNKIDNFEAFRQKFNGR